MRCIKFCDFEIQIDHLVLTRRPDLVLINKKKGTCHLVNFINPVDHSENKRKQKDRYLDLTRSEEPKKLEYENDDNTNCNWCTWNRPQSPLKKTGGIGNQKSQYHSDHSIV